MFSGDKPAFTAGRSLLWTGLVLVLLALAFVRQAFFVTALLNFPYQVATAEGGHVRTTIALAEERNPWSPEWAPQDYNCYGIFPNLVLAHLLGGASGSLHAHRAASFLALLLAAFALTMAAYHHSRSTLGSMALGLAAMGVWLFSLTPTAGTNAWAVLGYTMPLAMFAVAPTGFILLLAIFFSALAFFTKPYAALAGPLICIMLLGQGRYKAMWAAGLYWLLCLSLLLVAVETGWPGYLSATVRLHAAASDLNFQYMIKQTWHYFLALGWVWVVMLAWGWRQGPCKREHWMPLAVVFILLSSWLGRHQAAYMHYYFQLLQPLVVLMIPKIWGVRLRVSRGALGLLALGAYLCSVNGTLQYPRFLRSSLPAWQRAEVLLASARRPYAPACLTSLLTQNGQLVRDNGMSQWLSFSPDPALRGSLAEQRGKWEQGLEKGTFDLVFWSSVEQRGRPWPLHYRAVEELELVLPLDLDQSMRLIVLQRNP